MQSEEENECETCEGLGLVPCDECGATGWDKGDETDGLPGGICLVCNGEKKVECTDC